MEQEFNKYNFIQQRSDYLTPPELIDEIFQELNLLGILKNDKFDLDVCCSQKNIPACDYFIEGEKDGLVEEWKNFNYCNPPYKDCDKWVKKAYAEYLKGKINVLLIPARVETRYFNEYLLDNGYANLKNIHIKFLRKGYCFLNPDTKERMGVFKNPLCIVIMNGRGN